MKGREILSFQQFSVKYRPNTFDEVVGQDLNITLLKAIIKDPDSTPKTLLMQGAWGCGKTSLARIFARALNCMSKGSKPCGRCDSCKKNLDESMYYQEYDTAVIGSVDRIKELRDTFYLSSPNIYKVITFDEAHLASRASQQALLKILENPPHKTFFIFATTEVNKILDTVVSRSLELVFNPIPKEELMKSLERIIDQEKITISKEDCELIAYKSRGHARNAHMLLDEYRMVGAEAFKEIVNTARPAFVNYFSAIARGDTESLYEAISDILKFPLVDVQRDFEEILCEMMRSSAGLKGDRFIDDLVTQLGSNLYKIVKLCLEDWVGGSFKSDINMQTMLLCIYQMVNRLGVGSGKPQSSNSIPKSRYARR